MGMGIHALLKQNLFVLFLIIITVFSVRWYVLSQAENYPFQNISERVGPELSQGNIFSVPYNNRQVVFIGQTHYLDAFKELKKWLTHEGLTEKLVLILEGLPRDSSWEFRYRQSITGHGEEPIYGMEDGASLLVEAGIICRYITLGIIENYGIICPEHIVNFSSFEPLGEEVWEELSFHPANEDEKNLISELDSLVKKIRAAPDFKVKLNTFDLVKKQLNDVAARYNDATWANFYGIYASTALEHVSSMPSDLRNLTIQLLESEANIPTVRKWLLYDSVYREEYFAQTILWLMAHTDDSLPVVVLVGRGHLIGLLKALAEAQASLNESSE